MPPANIVATAVSTLDWLATPRTVLVVPVYQRQYRWSSDSCERLLADVRAVAAGPDGSMHFLGSVLYTEHQERELTQWLLIDGQQRVTTIVLLLAAIRDRLGDTKPEVRASIDRVLRHPGAGVSRLLLGRESAADLGQIIRGGNDRTHEDGRSSVWDNYGFFLEEIRDDPLNVWRGLERLEHVAITLGERASPQQVFESLNSTGVALRDHELIHNYVLMSLSHEEQLQIEDRYWSRIEASTGDSIDSFFRDYLIQLTGRDSDLGGERGVYDAFRRAFPSSGDSDTHARAAEWAEHADAYGALLGRTSAGDDDIGRALTDLQTFGSATFPLALAVYYDFRRGEIDKTELLALLGQLLSLYLRKMIVGETRDHLAAQLCRQLHQYSYPIRAISRRTPSDERVREGLRTRPLPHAGFVLAHLEGVEDVSAYQVEHVFPQQPTSTWRGDRDGEGPMWHQLTEAEQAKYREVLNTIGNLTLLEASLNAAAGNKSFLDKVTIYRDSQNTSVRELCDVEAWTLDAIAARTEALTSRLLEAWPRDVPGDDEDTGLVPVLDAPRKPGYYPGWQNEFEYAVFAGETWEVHNVRDLYRFVYQRLWGTHREHVLDFSARREGPVFATEAWSSRWEALGDHFLFMALFPQYMLASVQDLLDELSLADQMFVKYAEVDE